MNKKNIFLLLLAGIISSCANNGNFSNGDMGMLLGGATGALAGSAFGKGNGRAAAIAVGAVGGAYLGKTIGENSDNKQQSNRQVQQRR